MTDKRRVKRAALLIVVCAMGAAIGAGAYLTTAPKVRIAAAESQAPKVGDCLDVPTQTSQETGLPDASGAPYVVDCAADHHLQVLSVQQIPDEVAAWLPDSDSSWVGIGNTVKEDPADGPATYRRTPLTRFERSACGEPETPYWVASGVAHKMVYPSRSRWEWDSAPSLCVVSLRDYDGQRSLTRKIPGGVDLSSTWWDTVPQSVWRQCGDKDGNSVPCNDPAVQRIAVAETPITSSTGGYEASETAAEVLAPISPHEHRTGYSVCHNAIFHSERIYPPILSMDVPGVPVPTDMDFTCYLPADYLSQFTGRLDRSVLAPEVAK